MTAHAGQLDSMTSAWADDGSPMLTNFLRLSRSHAMTLLPHIDRLVPKVVFLSQRYRDDYPSHVGVGGDDLWTNDR